MDRGLLYDGALPLSTDVQGPQKMTMIALGRLMEALLGTATLVSGFGCLPTSPTASLNVTVNYGSIYYQATTDATAYGDLGTDLNLIVKQGILPPVGAGSAIAQTFGITPPGTGGFSQNYLIQATYADVDGNAVVLPYLNTSNPPTTYTSPWSGPNNNGQAQNTTRYGQAVLSLVAGTPAATGTQTTPAPSANNVGLWVITVANGQTQINSGNIIQYSGAPFLASLATTNAQNTFREVIQVVNPYGAPPAVAGQVGDTPVMVFSKANTPGIYFVFPVTTKINLNLPVKLRFIHTADANAGNIYVQLQFQSFTAGSVVGTPSYTAVAEAVAAPGTAGQMATWQTSTAVIPANALALNGFIACIVTRQGANGLDTNTGNWQLVQINLEQ